MCAPLSVTANLSSELNRVLNAIVYISGFSIKIIKCRHHNLIIRAQKAASK
jgi:hypothetical protein